MTTEAFQKGSISTYTTRLSTLAARRPNETAIWFRTDGEETRLTWRQLRDKSDYAAKVLQDYGVNSNSVVVLDLKGSPAWFCALYGAWRLGACVLPVPIGTTAEEMLSFVGLVSEWRPTTVISDAPGRGSLGTDEILTDIVPSVISLPDRVPHPGRIFLSGGSTGKKKLIVGLRPLSAGALARTWRHPIEQNKVMLGFSETVGFSSYFNRTITMLSEGGTLVISDETQPSQVPEVVRQFKVNYAIFHPGLLRAMADLPQLDAQDFASIEWVKHGATVCPPWLKRRWIDLLGPDRICEGYSASEGIGSTYLDGREWLDRPSSVGTPLADTVLRILDGDGEEVRPGEVGDIYMGRKDGKGLPFCYLGPHIPKVSQDGLCNVGDFGWVDENGYLFLGGRSADVFAVPGGNSVAPIEVEQVLNEIPSVRDSIVIGIPDESMRGAARRIHAIVEPMDSKSPPSVDKLRRYCQARLPVHAWPATFEYSPMPRDLVGKISRLALATERAEMQPTDQEQAVLCCTEIPFSDQSNACDGGADCR